MNRYKDQGFTIAAFPCNDFGEQEPASDPEIKQFCTTKYNVRTSLFSLPVPSLSSSFIPPFLLLLSFALSLSLWGKEQV